MQTPLHPFTKRVSTTCKKEKCLEFIERRTYRKDIDGIRAIAVLAVIIFHFGHLPGGYLGVDIFFVISGYLITGIIYRQVAENQFSIKNFYLRRIKRIIPLVLFICLITLMLGIVLMLPNDLKSLAQEIIATNFFSNNILQILTAKNYWHVANEYKPLIHTWSLGIEEQYYILYPFIFLLFVQPSTNKKRTLLLILSSLTLISIGLLFYPFPDIHKFYLLPFRFFELSCGGIVAIMLNGKTIKHPFSIVFILALLLIVGFGSNFLSHNILLLLIALITCGILMTANEKSNLSRLILENKAVVFLGKISFSMYMWHQVLLAFGRYAFFEQISVEGYVLMLALTIVLSVFTYYIIEQPFRHKIETRTVMTILVSAFFIITGASIFIYLKAGVIRNIPELEISKHHTSKDIHAKYSDRIYTFDNDFKSSNKIKILTIGNSFARDWANVLLESKFSENIEISHVGAFARSYLPDRAKEADYIFVTGKEKENVVESGIDMSKVWRVGTKNFGYSMGIFYNYNGDDYCQQRTHVKTAILQKNNKLKNEWGDRYIDLTDLIIDQQKTVPVFTPNCEFISHDCHHFSKAGAKYFASLLENQLDFIFNEN